MGATHLGQALLQHLHSARAMGRVGKGPEAVSSCAGRTGGGGHKVSKGRAASQPTSELSPYTELLYWGARRAATPLTRVCTCSSPASASTSRKPSSSTWSVCVCVRCHRSGTVAPTQQPLPAWDEQPGHSTSRVSASPFPTWRCCQKAGTPQPGWPPVAQATAAAAQDSAACTGTR